jgi:carbon storage regulator
MEVLMLVLSRKKNEKILLGDDITIVVVEIRGDKVRLGIEAPREMPVHRKEIYDAIHHSDAVPVSINHAGGQVTDQSGLQRHVKEVSEKVKEAASGEG